MSAALLFALIPLVMALIYFWPHEKQIETRVCPMCHVGTVRYEVCGAFDQLSFCESACDQCGYNKSGLTEDTL